MEYSIYKAEDLMGIYNYKELCDCFLALAKDDRTREKLESILYQGGYKNYKPSGGIGSNIPMVEIKRRAGLANLILTNPETFDDLVQSNITYFHGTSGNALPKILYNGILSVNDMNDARMSVATGEQGLSNRKGDRSHVSFTDVLDTAGEYSTLKDKYNNEFSFPVIIGTTKENVAANHGQIVSMTSLPEVGVKSPFLPKYISSVMVSSNHLNYIRIMVPSYIKVLADDGITNQFYSIDPDGMIEIDPGKYKEFASRLESKSISSSEMRH